MGQYCKQQIWLALIQLFMWVKWATAIIYTVEKGWIKIKTQLPNQNADQQTYNLQQIQIGSFLYHCGSFFDIFGWIDNSDPSDPLQNYPTLSNPLAQLWKDPISRVTPRHPWRPTRNKHLSSKLFEAGSGLGKNTWNPQFLTIQIKRSCQKRNKICQVLHGGRCSWPSSGGALYHVHPALARSWKIKHHILEPQRTDTYLSIYLSI